MKNIFVHHVYFWLKNPESKDDFDQLVAGLETLSKVKSLKSFHLGIPASTNRDVIDGSYSISWLTIFHSPKDEEKYQKDPIHLDFVKNCQHLWAKVVVYDSIDQ
ncbi:MAG: Dabb family protein [Saprospiraceae bacterium]|nr:Dabb family protein [Saprospiraceae bacterium]